FLYLPIKNTGLLSELLIINFQLLITSGSSLQIFVTFTLFLNLKTNHMHFLWFILLGAVAGWLAGQITKGGGFGLLGNIIVGILGAVIGGWLAGVIGILPTNLLGELLVATGGAIVLLFLVSLIKKS
ncbi:MAG: GlsB/YeaQ/YmgE family stress response membrane protein, partial [Bacteroidota bacterium]